MGLKETFVLPLAKRWIAGVGMDSALEDAKKANARGIGVVINFLGEEIKDPATADAHAEEYLKLQRAIAEGGITGYTSVKLTQLGMGADDEGMRTRVERIATNAEKLGQLLWIDMEGSQFMDVTIDEYLRVHERHRGVGVALQSYSRRSETDLKRILDSGGAVRLVKGAYRESSQAVFSSKAEVAANFVKLMGELFGRGNGFAIATHDTALVDRAKALAGSSKADFHFELLKGIRDPLKEELVRSGFKVSEYIPYGDSWYGYSKRRITEHPSNIWLLLRSLV